MEDGMIYYWLSWIFWIAVTFFMEKTWIRVFFSAWILLMIIGSSLYIPLLKGNVSLSFLILFAGTIVLYTKIKNVYYALFASFTITIGYAAILIWEKVTPIWFILPREIFISLIICIMVTVFTDNFINRILIGLLGVIFGEILYSFMLSSYNMQHSTGQMEFFDQVTVMVLFLFPPYLLQKARTIMVDIYRYTRFSAK
ncbi:YphA family membrane protein [Virgibacillus sp. W0181]|uniref:YphA family membrane protein n=1 Tax=Virgibacillus sp. W0181 TaxID=3391581 RepID=UPI003F4665A5